MIEITFDPILREETYKNSFFPIIPVPGPKRAILLMSSVLKAGTFIITNETRVKTSDIKRGKYDQLVEIDLHPNNIRIKEEVIGEDDVSKFMITIIATASVTEPDVVYEEQIHDVARYVEGIFLPQIQDIASAFSVNDSAGLKRAIRDELGDSSYLGSEISINTMNVNVRIDKNYEELLKNNKNLEYNIEFEKNKANAAKMMQTIYADNITAVFSEFAVGKITSEEAVKRSKDSMSKDFDERMRQITEVTEYIKGLERDEMINKGDTLKNVQALLSGIVSSIPNIALGDNVNSLELSEEKKQTEKVNIYEAFEEDEE